MKISYLMIKVILGTCILLRWPEQIISNTIPEKPTTLRNSFLDMIRGHEFLLSKSLIQKLQKNNTPLIEYVETFRSPLRGYLNCLNIGVPFMLIMPIVFIVWCCCQCCCKTPVPEEENTKNKSCMCMTNKIGLGCFTINFFIIISIMFFGAIVASISIHTFTKSFVSTKDNENVALRVKNILNKGKMTITSTRENIIENFGPMLDYLKNYDIDTRIFKEVRSIMSQMENIEKEIKYIENDFATNMPIVSKKSKELPSSPSNNNVNEKIMNKIKSKIVEIKNTMIKAVVPKNFTNKRQSLVEPINKTLNMLQLILKNLTNALIEDDVLLSKAKNTITNFTSDWITELDNLKKTYLETQSVEDRLRNYGTLFTIIAGILTFLLFFTILLPYYCGMIFEFCVFFDCKQLSQKFSFIGRVTPTMLTIGKAFSLGSSGSLMFITTTFFLVGGLLQTEICRHASTSKAIQSLDNELVYLVPKINNSYLTVFVNVMGNKPIENLLIHCAHDPIGSFINKTSLKHFINQEVLSLFFNNGSLFSLPLMNHPIYVNIDKAIKLLNNSNMGDLTSNSRKQMENLKKIHNIDFVDENGEDTLKSQFEPIERLQASKESLILSLNNFDINDIFTNCILDLSFDLMVKLLSNISCSSVQDILRYSIDTLCISIVEPINGIWLGLGIFVIFIIPSVIVATFMTNIHRQLNSMDEGMTDLYKEISEVDNPINSFD